MGKIWKLKLLLSVIGRNSIKVGLTSIHFPYNVVGFPSISYSSIPAWRNSDDYNDHNDYNDYNDYSDYNNYDDYGDSELE